MKTLFRKLHGTTPIENAAVSIVKTLKANGFSAFFVGGFVRDSLLDLKVKDIDIATDATPDEITGMFKRTIPTGAAFGVITVVIDHTPFEVATFRAEADYSDGRRPDKIEYANAEADAVRRDFTINALFYDPVEACIIDFSTGLSDLDHGILQTVGEPGLRFSEDYLRMLRAVRFTSRLGFKPDTQLIEAIKSNASKIADIAQERIYVELTSMLTGKNPHCAFDLLLETGLLDQILPEVVMLKGCDQPKQFHPEGDVWNHTMLALSKLDENPSPELAWATLLHDIGKPDTLSYKVDGTPTTPAHAAVGAGLAEKILRRLKASRRTIEIVTNAVHQHMTFINIQQMRPAKLRRFLSDEHFPLHLELHRVDCQSASGMMENYHFAKEKLEVLESGDGSALPPPLITGKDLIDMGFKPDFRFKKILTKVQDMQLAGTMNSKAEALNWAKENFNGA